MIKRQVKAIVSGGLEFDGSSFILFALIASFFISSVPAFSIDSGTINRIRSSTVKIASVSIHPSYYLPWRMKAEENNSGSGVIIDGNLVLTNAHVVSDSTYIEVQKENDPRKYRARVKFIGHECDLALLSLDDPKFFNGTSSVSVGNNIPELTSTVATFGYPTGGDRISVTEGVISRIELSTYSHSLKSQLLVLQTDAAINPGNSGGPVFLGGTLVGLAFQVLGSAENIGYIIPCPVIRHFIDDVKDTAFDGFPQLGIYWEKLESEDYRLYLGMDAKQSGILVTRVLEDGPSYTYLHEGDVITKAGGVVIANDGTIPFNDGRLPFSYALSSRQVGKKIEIDILRNKKAARTSVPLKKRDERIPTYNEFESLPRYIVYAGFIFQPLNREFLKSWDSFWYNADPSLLFYYYYCDEDDLAPDRDEFIIINHVLPDASNTYVSETSYEVVESINGKKIGRLEDVEDALGTPSSGFHVIKLEGITIPIVLKAAPSNDAHKKILARYGIRLEKRLENKGGYER